MAPRLPKVALKEAVLHSRARFGSGPGSKGTSVVIPKGGLVVSHSEYLDTSYRLILQQRSWTSWRHISTVSFRHCSNVLLFRILTHHASGAYWGEDADDFRPERFIDTPQYRWPREAFLAFSVGGRACIGQRAGQVQSLCILAHIIRYYRVSVPPHLVGLPFEKQRSSLLRFWMGASLTPTDLKLTFTRRSESI